MNRGGRIPTWRSVLPVVAHPDDEILSGLSAILSALADQGAKLAVLCLTRGEASTLHGVVVELGDIQASQLAAAAEVLGVPTVQLLGHPERHLADTPTPELAIPVICLAEQSGAQGLLVFDPTGATGHPDHRQATAAALGRRTQGWPAGPGLNLPPTTVADTLNNEYDTSFIGHQRAGIDLIVPVDR